MANRKKNEVAESETVVLGAAPNGEEISGLDDGTQLTEENIVGAVRHYAENEAQKAPADKPAESKAAKFVRLANRRVPAAAKRLNHVLNLANRNQYQWTPEQASKIVSALRDAVDQIERKLNGSGRAEADAWTL